MSDSDDFDLSDDEMADEGTAATVPLRPLHASRAAPPQLLRSSHRRSHGRAFISGLLRQGSRTRTW